MGGGGARREQPRPSTVETKPADARRWCWGGATETHGDCGKLRPQCGSGWTRLGGLVVFFNNRLLCESRSGVLD